MESMIRTLFLLLSRVTFILRASLVSPPDLVRFFWLSYTYWLCVKLLSGLLAGFWLLPPYRPPLSYPRFSSLLPLFNTIRTFIEA